MPWEVSGVVEKRKEFLAEYATGEWTMTDLCRAYGITRPTGYAVLRRFATCGEAGLREQSRAPRRHPNQTAVAIEAQVLALRRKHPSWGPRTLKTLLERAQSSIAWPAASTIGEMLDREGLTRERRKRRKTEPYTQPFQSVQRPNDCWCGDFKGWFCTRNGERIDPLTITDACSRYLLRCQAVAKTDTERARAIFEAAFREYGMPRVIRTDNGAPFASRAIAGLSRLAVWWIKLGIVPERIDPGHPEQNGRHERMHRTLKEATAAPPEANRQAQQRAFDRFREEYNEVRPHQALAMQTPSAVYVSSLRQYPVRVPEPEYGSAMLVRRVDVRGAFSWKQENVFLSETLWNERVGLLPIDDRYYRVYLAWLPVARFDSHKRGIERLREEDRQGQDR
jgi:transposase InsO family protein